ncbi:MAG: hypothetical protein Q4P72_06880, partial [Eubacteriales bacterium]|nr:hypothetical protein [Eubacteriales bacterium]
MPTVISLGYEDYARVEVPAVNGEVPPKAILKVEASSTGLHYHKMIETSDPSSELRSLEQAMISLGYGSYNIYSAAYEAVSEAQIVRLYNLGMARIHGVGSENYSEALRELN